MSGRYPGYDVLDKRNTLSWNEPTRRAVDHRLAVHPGPRFFTESEWLTLSALCARIVTQSDDRPPVPIPAYIDDRLHSGRKDGYRFAEMLPQGEAWRAALAALDDEATRKHGARFHQLPSAEQDALLARMQQGDMEGPLWRGMPSSKFFSHRVLHDVTNAYYGHPIAWSEMGWGGPASPRGYVRLEADRRDPWEASEAKPGQEAKARRENRDVG